MTYECENLPEIFIQTFNSEKSLEGYGLPP